MGQNCSYFHLELYEKDLLRVEKLVILTCQSLVNVKLRVEEFRSRNYYIFRLHVGIRRYKFNYAEF